MRFDRTTRRGFLAGVSAAMAAPMFIPRHVLGDDNNAPANEKIRLAAVGIGKMMYGSHIPHFVRMPELTLVAVCDVDTSRRDAGKKRVDDAYGNQDCAVYNDYQEILARDDIDAVACATPDHWHAMVILDVCKAGKDMYCEKPLTNNLTEAKRKYKEVDNLYSQLDDPEKPLIKSALVHLLSEILLAESKHDKALNVWREYEPRLQPFARVRDNLPLTLDFEARVFASQGEVDKAIAEYERLISEDPQTPLRFIKNPFLYCRLGRLYERKSEWVKARDVYRTALEIWRNADADLPKVKEVALRLSQLDSVSPAPGG